VEEAALAPKTFVSQDVLGGVAVRTEDSKVDSKLRSGSEMTRTVTFVVLIAYIFILVSFIASGYFASDKPEPAWFDLVKSGFTTLGSALTLILGYYFGQREVMAVKDAKKEAAEQIEEVQNVEGEKRETLVGNLLKRAPMASQPDTLTDVDKTTLPAGKPKKDP
jgi:hypothetical protein